MKKFMRVVGFLVAGFGLLVLSKGAEVPGIVFILIGIGTMFLGDILKKRARKELMELKSLLDNGVIDKNEYEEKSRDLKDKI